MIKIDSGNVDISHIVENKSSSGITSSLLSKRDSLGFIDADTYIDVESIESYLSSVSNDFDALVVLGIGGSALGTKAMLEALYGKYYNETAEKKIYVLDNIDPHAIEDTLEVIDISRTLFCFISKSGSTIETLSEYLFFRKKCQEVNTDWKKQFCFIVGENCKMRDELEKDFQTFYIPENIGGRFSVFTPVGLVPLAFAGIDIRGIKNTISSSKERFVSDSIENNPAVELAYIQYAEYQAGKNISVFFPYSSRMFQIGEWYKQLMGESIGKDGHGITLTSSLGVTDQHSQLQLFQDGPKDKLFVFLDIENFSNDFEIDSDIEKYTFANLLKIEKYGTETSLKKEGIPCCNISLSELNLENIVELLYMFEFQIAYLGELFEINAFDQPGVEKSKIITKAKLKQELGDVDIFSKAFY